MWYFAVKQPDLENPQFQQLQQIANLTETEVFYEPYPNYCLFEVLSEHYQQAMDYLDRQGIHYDVSTSKPTRDELLSRMRG